MPAQTGDVYSNATLRSYLEDSNCEILRLGSVLGGFDVLCAVAGGKKDPAILITAGSHADEVAGVHAALALLRGLVTQHKLYVIPVRDPFGFEGYRANLQFAAGSSVRIEGPADVYEVLRGKGKVLYENNTYVVAEVGQYVFAYDVGVDFPTSSVGRRIEDVVQQDRKALERLAAAKRVVAPWNLPMPRHGDYFRRGARGMIVTASGFVGNFNRFFDVKDAPAEIQYPRNLVDELKPGLILDLHEGYGRGFYVYKPESADPSIDRIASALTAAVQDYGGQTSTPEELQPFWGPKLGHDRSYFGNGTFYAGSSIRSGFSQYCQTLGPAFTFETGAFNPISWRTDLHVWAAVAAIKSWESSQA
jgi:hypothetical protein